MLVYGNDDNVASRDQNRVPVLMGVSSVDGKTPVAPYVDPITRRLYVDISGGSVSILSATGTIDGGNKNFVFISKPTILYIDGLAFTANSKNGDGNYLWTWNEPTLTVTTLYPPLGDIYGI